MYRKLLRRGEKYVSTSSLSPWTKDSFDEETIKLASKYNFKIVKEKRQYENIADYSKCTIIHVAK